MSEIVGGTVGQLMLMFTRTQPVATRTLWSTAWSYVRYVSARRSARGAELVSGLCGVSDLWSSWVKGQGLDWGECSDPQAAVCVCYVDIRVRVRCMSLRQ